MVLCPSMGFLICLGTRISLILTNHQEFCPALRPCSCLGSSCRGGQGIWAELELLRLCLCGASRTGTNSWESITGLGGKQKALTGDWGRVLRKNKARAELMSCDTAAQPLGNLHSQNLGKPACKVQCSPALPATDFITCRFQH